MFNFGKTFAVKNLGGTQWNSSRNMATLKDIQLRLKAVKNIEKITKSMKMISSTKLVRAQKAMEVGRAYGKSFSEFFKHIEPKVNENPTNRLFIACSSDRGLCGGIHSSVSKFVRQKNRESPSTTSIVVVGDKSKPQIARDARKNIKMHFNQLGKNIPTFREALSICDSIQKQNFNADSTTVVYNRFRSVLVFETTPVSIYSVSEINACEKLGIYEYEDEIMENFAEFAFATQVYWSLAEGHAAEMAARRTAMENAAKNAGEIIQGLTLKYNRTRQAFITNELVDIITGAAAL